MHERLLHLAGRVQAVGAEDDRGRRRREEGARAALGPCGRPSAIRIRSSTASAASTQPASAPSSRQSRQTKSSLRGGPAASRALCSLASSCRRLRASARDTWPGQTRERGSAHLVDEIDHQPRPPLRARALHRGLALEQLHARPSLLTARILRFVPCKVPLPVIHAHKCANPTGSYLVTFARHLARQHFG